MLHLAPSFIRRRIEHRPNLLKIVGNIGWLFFDKILRMGVGLLLGVWIARHLGPEQFGLLNFATAFIALFSAIATLGLQGIVVRELVYKPSKKEETLGTAAALQSISGLLTYGLILGTIFWLRPNDMLAKTVVAILASTMLFKASEVAAYWFESQVQSKYTVRVKNGVFLLFAGVKTAMILRDAPLIPFAWAMLGEAMVVAALMVTTLGLRGPGLSTLSASFGRTKTLLSDSWPLLLSGFAITIYMKIDQIMLGQMVDDGAVGVYSAAVRVSEVWYFVPMAIVASVFPTVLETKKRNEALFYERLQQLFDLMAWLAIGIAIPITFISTSIISTLFSDSYTQAGTVLAIHTWAGVFVFLGVASSKWFLAENKQLLSLQRTAIGALANIALNLLLIPKYGALGAAWATVLSYAIADMFADLLQAETHGLFRMKLRSLNLVGVIIRATAIPRN